MRIGPRNNACARFLSSSKLRALQKVKIMLSLYSMTLSREAAEVARVKTMVEAYLPGKEIEVCKSTIIEHYAYWRWS